VAGRTVRAPRLVQTVGMEWAWRLAHEPKRLWKRYLVRDSRFIGLAVREAITALRHR
jgi:N-acetylglucosaminyldiphosphoundecaprenol N-acetyl-beta-D-mannosaminyltransferase